MSDKPWLTDPKYHGMSPEAARRSYEGWLKAGKPAMPWKRPSVAPAVREMRPPVSDEEIARRKLIVEILLAECERDEAAAIAWFREAKARRPRGFRALRREARTEST